MQFHRQRKEGLKRFRQDICGGNHVLPPSAPISGCNGITNSQPYRFLSISVILSPLKFLAL